MKDKVKTVIAAASIFLNATFIAALIIAYLFKQNTSMLSFPAPKDGYVSAAAVCTAPDSANLVFCPVEITLNVSEKAFLQYSVFLENKQKNMIVTALYDPLVISVSQTGWGIEITALGEGSTVMQTLTNSGITDVAVVKVSDLR